MRPKWLLWGSLGLVGAAVVAVVGGEVVRRLWNWLMPTLVGARAITFWQALGLLALCRILVGGFGRGGYHGPVRRGRRLGRSADRMADRVGRRWQTMSADERARFRQRVREQAGFDPAT